MQKAKIIKIGNIKNRSLEEEANKLIKRIPRIETTTLKEVKNKNIDDVKKQEESLILQKIPNNLDEIYLLKEDGKHYTTQQFYEEIKNKSPTFIISGPYGPSKNLQSQIPNHISLSKMTFTHEQAYYLLLEQLYRVECLKTNKKYTK